MTQPPQPPSPYQPPTTGPPYAGYQPAYAQGYPSAPGYAYGYGNPIDNLLAPARRAMWMMLILGVITILFGGCFSLVGAMWSDVVKQMPPESQAQFDRLEQQLQGVHAQTYLLAAGITTLVVGVLHVGLSFFVRRGSIAPIVLGILLCGGMLLLFALAAVGNAISGQLPGLCFGVIAIALWGLLLAWLIQAASRAGQVAAMRGYGTQPYGAQYAQYQQTQPSPGYGYPPPPPPQQQQQPQSPPDASGWPPPPPPGAGPV